MKQYSPTGLKEISCNRITDSSALSRGEVWVLLKYPDNSEFGFLTTLNTSILRDRGILLEEGNLVRLDKKYYIKGDMVYRQFPYDGATITMWEELTYTNERSATLSKYL